MSVAQWFQNWMTPHRPNVSPAQAQLAQRQATMSLESLDATSRRVVEVVLNTSLKYHCVPDMQHSGQIFRVFPMDRPRRLAFLFLGNAVPRPYRGTLQAIAGEVGGILKCHLVVYDPVHGPAAIQIGLDPTMERRKALTPLPPLTGYQVVVFGPTGSGKSTACRHIARARLESNGGISISLDPHYGPGRWHPSTIVVGAGARFADIMESLRQLELELHRRLDLLAEEGEAAKFTPVTVTVDELYALQEHEPESVNQLITLAQQGRKVKLYFILAPHDDTVASMGMSGKGGVRENFVFIKLSLARPGQEHKPRTAQVFAGSPRSRFAQYLGEYLIPAPTTYQGHARRLQNLTGVFTGGETLPWVPNNGSAVAASQAASAAFPSASQTVSTASADASDAASWLSESASAPRKRSEAPEIAVVREETYKSKYTNGSEAAVQLANYLASYGIAKRRIAAALPFAAGPAFALAGHAVNNQLIKAAPPTPNSDEERELILDLYRNWGMPVNRLANLFLSTPERIASYLDLYVR